ncbi:DUF5317 domain-containing protein [Demequina sp. TTPB684]|uniref:DUF5317 domain-containing protein n=1 Tax=unclassified Demequina TaxID=2620311 RepID=UPI001CF1E346|nr:MULTISPECIES: DUF5317 domain-containing protein [unclassified Demequina]MCB2412309.1 DUF5317 domain-containing protein [Demequina sp. TTPB684]UPU89496.1 DUF5317 domain-containing protein [Demequina sp. TMPB413]
MLVLVLCALAVVSPLILWRWPAGLLLRRWRWPLLIWAALALQLVALEVPMPHTLASVLHILTYAVAVTFLWFNRSAPGVWWVGSGAALNGIVIALNGGTLPASRSASEAAGIDTDGAFANSAVLDSPVLPWLGDVFAWPAPLPLANTFSVGDVLIVLGAWIAAWSGTRRLGKATSPTAAVGETTPMPGQLTPGETTQGETTQSKPTPAQPD